MLKLLFNLFTDRHRDQPRRPRRGEAGFTLVELMVVIVIIGLLAAVVMVNVMPSQDKAMVTKARADIAALEQAMEMYRLDQFDYPASLDQLAQPVAGGTRAGGYIKSLPQDPWKRPYQLNKPGRSGEFAICSLGADGAAGGSGPKADICSDDA